MNNDDKIKTNKELAKEIVDAWNKKWTMKHKKNLNNELKKQVHRNNINMNIQKIKTLLQQVKREKSSEKDNNKSFKF